MTSAYRIKNNSRIKKRVKVVHCFNSFFIFLSYINYIIILKEKTNFAFVLWKPFLNKGYVERS